MFISRDILWLQSNAAGNCISLRTRVLTLTPKLLSLSNNLQQIKCDFIFFLGFTLITFQCAFRVTQTKITKGSQFRVIPGFNENNGDILSFKNDSDFH